MKRIFGLLVVLLIGISQSVAQTAYIEKCWVDYDVYNNGNKGMQIHIKFNVRGLKNRNIWVAASFYDEKSKNPIKCYADGYHNSSGMLVYQYFTPPYEYSVYDDFKLFMPYYVFDNSSMQPGKYTYFASIGIEGGEQIRTSNWYAFTYTRGSNPNPNPNPNPNSNRFANSRATGETWTKYLSGGDEMKYTQQSDGSVKTEMISNCWICHGSGKCSICNGQGGNSAYILGNYVYTQCTSCRGNRKCWSCYGSGRQVISTDILYPVENFPQLANNPNYYNRKDGYYDEVPYPVNISHDHTNNDNTSNSNRTNNNASPERCAQYVRNYNLTARMVSDLGTSPYNSYSDSRRRELQSDMRRIRNENASCGCTSIAKSMWEDWDGTR